MNIEQYLLFLYSEALASRDFDDFKERALDIFAEVIRDQTNALYKKSSKPPEEITESKNSWQSPPIDVRDDIFVPCDICFGSGYDEWTALKCHACNGTGEKKDDYKSSI